MVIVIKDQTKGGVKIERINRHMWQKMSTVRGWIEANPKIWTKITNYVYGNNLHRKKGLLRR